MGTHNGEAVDLGSIPTFFADYLESNQNGDFLSAEDNAWVDSCLVKDPEVSQSDWSSLKDALLEILTLHPGSEQSSVPVTDSAEGRRDTDMILAGEAVVVKPSGRKDDDDDVSVSMNEETETDSDDSKEKTLLSSSQDYEQKLSETSLRNVFLPSYNKDEAGMVVPVDAELDTGFSLYDVEPSTKDIFKVWDLIVPAEEGELVKQLYKAVSESSARLTPPKITDLDPLEDLKDESLDNLIAGFSDMSLNRISS